MGPTKKSSKTALEGNIRQWFHHYIIFLYHQHWLRYQQCNSVWGWLGGNISVWAWLGGKIPSKIALDGQDIIIWLQFQAYFEGIHYTSYFIVWTIIPIYKAPNWPIQTPTSFSVQFGADWGASPICPCTPPWLNQLNIWLPIRFRHLADKSDADYMRANAAQLKLQFKDYDWSTFAVDTQWLYYLRRSNG